MSVPPPKQFFFFSFGKELKRKREKREMSFFFFFFPRRKKNTKKTIKKRRRTKPPLAGDPVPVLGLEVAVVEVHGRREGVVRVHDRGDPGGEEGDAARGLVSFSSFFFHFFFKGRKKVSFLLPFSFIYPLLLLHRYACKRPWECHRGKGKEERRTSSSSSSRKKRERPPFFARSLALSLSPLSSPLSLSRHQL